MDAKQALGFVAPAVVIVGAAAMAAARAELMMVRVLGRDLGRGARPDHPGHDRRADEAVRAVAAPTTSAAALAAILANAWVRGRGRRGRSRIAWARAARLVAAELAL